MNYILDSAVFINTSSFSFSEKHEYFVTSPCEAEVKEWTARMRLDAAFQRGDISITDPCPASIQLARALAKKHGDARLSDADESVLALALEIADRKEKVCVYTDDYSLQNLLKWRKIPFHGILQKGISMKKSFKKRTKTQK
jgi:rRNA maturation endonuclease Nob1